VPLGSSHLLAPASPRGSYRQNPTLTTNTEPRNVSLTLASAINLADNNEPAIYCFREIYQIVDSGWEPKEVHLNVMEFGNDGSVNCPLPEDFDPSSNVAGSRVFFYAHDRLDQSALSFSSPVNVQDQLASQMWEELRDDFSSDREGSLWDFEEERDREVSHESTGNEVPLSCLSWHEEDLCGAEEQLSPLQGGSGLENGSGYCEDDQSCNSSGENGWTVIFRAEDHLFRPDGTPINAESFAVIGKQPNKSQRYSFSGAAFSSGNESEATFETSPAKFFGTVGKGMVLMNFTLAGALQAHGGETVMFVGFLEEILIFILAICVFASVMSQIFEPVGGICYEDEIPCEVKKELIETRREMIVVGSGTEISHPYEVPDVEDEPASSPPSVSDDLIASCEGCCTDKCEVQREDYGRVGFDCCYAACLHQATGDRELQGNVEEACNLPFPIGVALKAAGEASGNTCSGCNG
ncbi:MAG: hypothetical protein KDD64_16515, partial [Bdellovibrionales bacterium]|nr:hypothetical protein [Bdellovibrionales bacterium]